MNLQRRNSAESERRWRERLRNERRNRPRGEKGCWLMLEGLAVALAILPFVFLLIVSISPNHLNFLPLYRVSGNVTTDYESNTTAPIKVTVGPAGGCMWYEDVTGPPIKCLAALPFRPDPAVLHLPSNQTLTDAFPVTLGRALALNHLATAISGLTLVLIALDAFVWRRNIYRFFVYFAAFTMWLTFAFDIAYASTLTKWLDRDYGYLQGSIGTGFWFVMVATIVTMFFICGCGDIGPLNATHTMYGV